MNLLSTALRSNILEGKDINLAAQLIPYFEKADKEDVRLKHALTITEFINAFGRYKRVMCDAYPERREALDRYEEIIVFISDVYGPCSYEYHKLFSFKSAGIHSNQVSHISWRKKFVKKQISKRFWMY